MAAPAITEQALPTAHRPGIAVLGASALSGLVAGLLVPAGPIGLGFPIAMLGIFVLSIWVQSHALAQVHSAARRLWIPILLFSALAAWRDSSELRFLNLSMVILFGGVLAIRSRPSAIEKGTVFDYPFRALGGWAVAIVDGVALVANDIAWRLLPQNAHGRQLAGALRGAIIATPLLLIFGALFASADAGFDGLLSRIHFNGEAVFQQFLIGGAFAWMTAGFFRRMFIGDQSAAPPIVKPPVVAGTRLGSMEIAVILGSLNVLFLAFVSTQARHFFGGFDVIRTTADLGVADFARRGFFELVAVTGLTLPILLGLHALLDPESLRMRRLYKVLATSLIILLVVVMLSASLKMKLYMDGFGLTTLRLYVAAALTWLAVVFGWFTFTTLRERSNRFAWGGLVSLAVAVLGLNLLNPDRYVAEWNLGSQREVDWNHLATLSEDAAPVIEPHLNRMPADARKLMIENRGPINLDWRSLNLTQLRWRLINPPQ